MDTRTLTLLEHRGVIDSDRVTTTATMRHCRRCGRAVLAALADDGPQTPGLRVTCDPRPLTPAGELAALLAGLPTYGRIAGSLTWRCVIRIHASPAGKSYPVHHKHKCNPPAGIEYAPTTKTAQQESPTPSGIPF